MARLAWLLSSLLLQANALAPTLRLLLRRRATVADREAALAQVMAAPDRDALLDECLQPSRIPRWLARAPVSWPARDLAALDRVLKLGGDLDDAGAARRALLSTLRQLPEAGGAVRLEREARRRSKLAPSFDEMLARTPDLSTPAFELVDAGDDFQVRRYADFSVVRAARRAPVAAEGPELQNPKMAGAGAFQALAGYIFGGNGREEKMAMTTPVFTRGGDMEFVLPEAYWSDASRAPAPTSDVELSAGQNGLVAAAFFGGYATKDEVERRSAALVDAVRASGAWTPVDDPYQAAYNDPFTPPWRRRNEVLVAVEAAN